MTTGGGYGADDLERPSERQHDDDGRTPFQKDRDRLLYSSFFRRMAGKTQVVASTERGNFHTRLTHSLKVAQVGRRIAEKQGFLDPDLVETACLAHDIGHPPFGHAGEAELRLCCERAAAKILVVPASLRLSLHREAFEGNAQNLRIVADLAVHYQSGIAEGLNRPVFCIRSGWVLGLDVRSGFERSSRVRIRLVGCRRARCAGAVG